ncbi:MAG: hypothetical protein RIG77_15185 [Cyclobacteriaceae bacterium]
MKDRLEEIVRSNRADFDTEVPSDGLWAEIETNLDKDVSRRDFGWVWVWKVAAVLFLISTLVLLFKNEPRQDAPANNGIALYDGYSDELVEVENYYTKLIASKKEEILRYDGQNSQLLTDINSLDSMYTELKNDLQVNKNDDRLISAMIRNLQLRVGILNKQIRILENIKKVENNEKIII